MRPATGTPIGGFSRTRASARYYYGYVRSRSHTMYMEMADKSMAARGLTPGFPYLDRDLLEFVMSVPGEMICFEGTYTHTFSGNPHPTPRYDYNQVMYRLELGDERLRAGQ